MSTTKVFYTVGQLAELLQVSRNTIMNMADKGRLPKPYKLHPGRRGSVRFPVVATDAAIAALQVA